MLSTSKIFHSSRAQLRRRSSPDAHEIARRLHLGDIERNARTYHATEEEYRCAKLLRTRHQLVQLRQQVTNQIRSLLRAYRIAGLKRATTCRHNPILTTFADGRVVADDVFSQRVAETS